jgi:hypothetical protein
MIKTIQDLENFTYTIPAVDTLKYLHENLGQFGIKVVYEKNIQASNSEGPIICRIMLDIFTRRRTNYRFKFPGAVLVWDDNNRRYRIASVPFQSPRIRYENAILKSNFPRNEPITKATDGTTVTLYYYNNKWVISTRKGYDVGRFKWMSGKTYSEVVNDVLETLPGFDYNNLDKTKNYTFGFNHPDFHPFRGSPENPRGLSAWFIQSFSLASGVSTTENIGIPFQETERFSSFQSLIQCARNAYDDYKNNGVCNYGYIVTVNNIQYLVESTLMKNIRRVFYNNNSEHSPDINHIKYTVVNEYINKNHEDVFDVLFPQYRPVFTKLDEIVADLTRDVLAAFNGDNTTPQAAQLKLEIARFNNIILPSEYGDEFVKRSILSTECIAQMLYDGIREML